MTDADKANILILLFVIFLAVVLLIVFHKCDLLIRENAKLKGYLKTLHGIPGVMDNVPTTFAEKIRKAMK